MNFLRSFGKRIKIFKSCEETFVNLIAFKLLSAAHDTSFQTWRQSLLIPSSFLQRKLWGKRRLWHRRERSNYSFLVTSAVTANNVGVFKLTIHDLSNSSYWYTTLVYHVPCTPKFWFKGRQCITRISWIISITKRDLGFNHEDICRKLEIISEFHTSCTSHKSIPNINQIFSLFQELSWCCYWVNFIYR